MLPTLRTRRRTRYGAPICALIAALLLLLSVSLLHSRLGADLQRPHSLQHYSDVVSDPLLEYGDPDDSILTTGSDDRIDEHDDAILKDSDPTEEEFLRTGESEEDEEDGDQARFRGYFFDHVDGVFRRVFDKRSIDQWEDYVSFDADLGFKSEDGSKAAFGSDDVPVDEGIRGKMTQVKGVEDVLLLKSGNSPLREGWGDWFDKKGDFLRRDRMFKSNLELLNPMHNPLLQDPDGTVVTGLTRGDKLVQKFLLNGFKKVPFLMKKPLAVVGSASKLKLESESKFLVDKNKDIMITFGGDERLKGKGIERVGDGGTGMKAERRTLKSNGTDDSHGKSFVDGSEGLSATDGVNSVFKNDNNEEFEQKNEENIEKLVDMSMGKSGRVSGSENMEANSGIKSEFSGQIYADGKRWGYFPGLHPHHSFLNFMNAFFRKGKCSMRIFMVWNSPSWMLTVRHHRCLESLFSHHRDACVVVFTETIELNFFHGLVKDGFKVAAVMPNLDELLKDTPTHIFASVWHEWRKTKFYSIHYSELIRLAALYKYGGIYLDFDLIVLKSLSSLNNAVGLEDEHSGSALNGAVMAFRKHSPFIMKCLIEYYSTYDDTRIRWNGADLLTRVAKSLSDEDPADQRIQLKVQPSFALFPISSKNITRFFTAPTTETERAQQDILFKKILNESFTFHFWSSQTSALIPEPDSLVAKLIDLHCIHCSDLL